ncbi:hypothetical protein [Chryseobacterium salviniae]|uniref:HEAT repeat-containing protein n=1 Tax=Chryseobacterium salviniae TaxID=3101750 RepID=A0ABU6HTG7_9FLAO|nr:hypothetical protein [Chryseobacterium sp. T9W2-O]MEC3876014.1 hypothetical protein [Chryseobacterium sp. T9W2-O]
MNTYWEKRFVELLNKSPLTKEEIEEKEYVREQYSKELHLETTELLKEIELNGLKVNELWDLVNTREPYPEAVDILTEHLKKPYHIKNKEGIVRALGVKEAGVKTLRTLLEEYPKFDDKHVKFAFRLSLFNILKLNNPKKLMAETNESDILIKGLIQLFIDDKKLSLNRFDKLFEEDFAEKIINKQNVK